MFPAKRRPKRLPYPGAMRPDTRPDRAATLGALLRVVAAAACWAIAAVLAKHVFDRGVPPVRLASSSVLRSRDGCDS